MSDRLAAYLDPPELRETLAEACHRAELNWPAGGVTITLPLPAFNRLCDTLGIRPGEPDNPPTPPFHGLGTNCGG